MQLLKKLNRIFKKIKYCSLFFIGSIILYKFFEYIIGDATPRFLMTNCYYKSYPNTLIGLFTFALYITMYLFKSVKKDTFWFYIKFYFVWLEISVFFSILFWAYIGYYPDVDAAFNRVIDDFWNMFITANSIIILSFPYNITVLLLSFLLIKKNRYNGQK